MLQSIARLSKDSLSTKTIERMRKQHFPEIFGDPSCHAEKSHSPEERAEEEFSVQTDEPRKETICEEATLAQSPPRSKHLLLLNNKLQQVRHSPELKH